MRDGDGREVDAFEFEDGQTGPFLAILASLLLKFFLLTVIYTEAAVCRLIFLQLLSYLFAIGLLNLKISLFGLFVLYSKHEVDLPFDGLLLL